MIKNDSGYDSGPQPDQSTVAILDSIWSWILNWFD
jgi:hypothetical protein